MKLLRLLGIILVVQGVIGYLLTSTVIGIAVGDSALLLRSGPLAVALSIGLSTLGGLLPSLGVAVGLWLVLVRSGWRPGPWGWMACGGLFGASMWSLLGTGLPGAIAIDPQLRSIFMVQVASGASSGVVAGIDAWRIQQRRSRQVGLPK